MGGHHQGRGRTAGLHAVGDIDDVGPVGALPHVVPVEHIVGVLVGVGQALGDEVAVHRVVVIAAVVGQEGVDVLRQRGVGHVGDRLILHRHLGLYIAEGGGDGIRVCLVLPVDLAVIAVGVCGRQAVIDILPIGDQGFAGIAYEPGGDGDIVVVLGLKGPFLGNLIAILVGVPLEIHMVGLGRLSHLGLTGRFQQSIISRIRLSIHIDLADHLQGVLGGPQLQGGGAVSVAHQIVVGEGGVIGPAADQGAHSRVHIGQLVFRTAPGPVLGLHDQQAGQRLVRDVKPAGLLQEFRAVHAGGKRHADPVLPLTGSLRDVDLDLPAVRPAGAVVYADLVGKVSIDPLIGADAGVRFLSVFNGGGLFGSRLVSTACHIQRPITDTLRIGHVLELLDLFISCILHVVGLAHFQRIFVLVHIQIRLIDVVPRTHFDTGVVINTPLFKLVVFEGRNPKIIRDPLVRPSCLLIIGNQSLIGFQRVDRICQRVSLTLDDPDCNALFRNLLEALLRPGLCKNGPIRTISNPAIVADEHIHQLRKVPHGLGTDSSAVGIANQDHFGNVVVLLEPPNGVCYFLPSCLIILGVHIRATHDRTVQLQPCLGSIVVGHISPQVVGLKIALIIEAFPVRGSVSSHIEDQGHPFILVVAVRHLIVDGHLPLKGRVVAVIHSLHIGQLIVIIDVVYCFFPHAVSARVMTISVCQAESGFHCSVRADGQDQIQLLPGKVIEGLSTSSGIYFISIRVPVLIELLCNRPAGSTEHPKGLVIRRPLVKGQGNGIASH